MAPPLARNRSRLLLVAVMVAMALAGCGDSDDAGGAADSPDGSPGVSSSAPQTPSPTEGVTEVALLTGTSAGGRVTTRPTPLPDAAAVRAYADRFRNDSLQGEILTAAERTEVPAGQRLAAAVVAIGCEVPTRVVGTVQGAGEVDVRAVLPPPTKQCLAPITTVALLLVPAD